MTGFRAMLRGSSITNERLVAIFTSAGSKRLSWRVWRRCNFKRLDIGLRLGPAICVGVRRVIASIFLFTNSRRIR